ncbi:LytTR family two component transcriptional regulator [Halospina denitrificans]|uniref:LytTR family two component transcriptional regulator n=1 Tax=Halospina denitrificans TaxID=332522 RepID=A0A4R7K2Z0_9GAMM|nr:LytTR family DNA-binding domain-containing protein [Halospina denitrificans]TDT44323.1 LytTR family two component transcriptional regulator [Halospina denitrificans]
MKERRVLIVDDEAPARQRLARLVDELPGYCVCGEASNGEEALSEADRTEPDIVLMDVRMPGMDGIAAASHLSRLATPPALIFCTAYDEYALEAFRVEATDYLVKPVRTDALTAALERAARTNRLQQDALSPETGSDEAIVVRSQRGVERIDLDRLYYAMADNKYVTLIHSQGETLCDYSLKELETAHPDRLMRIHRNTLVNTSYVSALLKPGNSGHKVRLSDPRQTLLDVSRRHATTVRNWLEENNS